MGKGTNNGETKRLSIRATPELREFLGGLARLGIHGGSAAEVARRFVENEVERMIREGIIGKTIESRRLIRADTTRGTKAKRDNP
ncbi:MAG TPA: hypothetical protein VHB47_09555 [Thermoanaerobaculia bacterium]|nr:hypothetical protein [Thermoanaerobaculia bacterium]